jgi:prolyl-tRNA synthetase
MFSKYSHEYQTITEHGEDTIFLCQNCNLAVNREILADQENCCPKCKNPSLEERKAIEVANIFKLMDRFSTSFDVAYKDETDSNRKVYMGCYGMGPSRIMGAVVEVHHDDKGILWPREIAPFHVQLTSLLQDEDGNAAVDRIYHQLQDAGVETLFDDRSDVSAGTKFAEADLIGAPLRVVVSRRTLASGTVELKRREDSEPRLVRLEELLDNATTALDFTKSSSMV